MPKWLRNQGPLWQYAWKLLCLKRLSSEEAFQVLLDEAESRQEGYLRETIAEIQETCPRNRAIRSLGGGIDESAEVEDEDSGGSEIEVGESSVGGEPQERHFMRIFGLLQRLLPETPAQRLEERVQAWIDCLRREVVLKDEEFLLLKMVFDEGLSVSEAGRRLQWNINEVSGRHRRLLQRLRKALEDCGLEKDFWFDEE